MAIAFARARYISRGSGGSAVRSAAYNAREAIRAEGTGSLYYFAHRDKPEHHEVLLPDGASPRLAEASVLWNAAEAAERRRDAQLAREIVLALPANAEVTVEDRIELARRFALEYFVSRGLAVQLDVHAPHVGDTESEVANWHAHLLISTRRVEGEGFAAKKARDLDPEVRRVGGRALVSEGEAWGEVWRDLQNRYFAEIGLEVRVEATSAVAQAHVGPVRMRAPAAEANARMGEVAQANAAAARDPEAVLGVLTRTNATFSERDIERFLAKQIADPVERAAVKESVLGHGEVLALFDRESGERAGRFTTRAVREQELRALGDAEAVATAASVRVGRRARAEALEARPLRADQRAAFDHAVGRGGLKVIEGRAGTGKSFVLAAIRDAHERGGAEVIGLSPTNSVAQDMRAQGFGRAGTVHSELFRLKNGLTKWAPGSVLIVDEAAMLDSRVTGELLAEAKRAGAKVIWSGDDRQLASIERGGLFAEMSARHGSAVLTEVTRQAMGWQRQAARDLAEGRFEEALRAFAREKAISWTTTVEEARAALVKRWSRDTAERPEASRFVFAYTNKEVDALNEALRAVRRERGELGQDHRFETKHGIAAFAVGDRVQFTDTLKAARIYNGNTGTITAIEPASGLIRARLDAPAGSEPREVLWSVSEFNGFRHGYAGTIYKGQGKTIDETYLLHSQHWRQASSYVALTRQRERAQLFVATETARDIRELARQMSRTEIKAASVSYATVDELSVEQRRVLDRERQGRIGPDHEPGMNDEHEKVGAGLTHGHSKDDESGAVLISAFVDPEGRDSLGRGLDARSVQAAVEADWGVRNEARAQGNYLAGAYRDPAAAGKSLEALLEHAGPVSAARRIESDPAVLGTLRGRTGMLAGAAARTERERAIEVATALAASVRRLGEARAEAEAGYRSSVAAQLEADAVVIPALSERAGAAVASTAAARTPEERAGVYASLRQDGEVARELDAFSRAFEKRFGEEAVRSVSRGDDGGRFRHASVRPEDHSALQEAGRAMRAIREGQRAQAQIEGERLVLREGLNRGRGLKM